MVNIKKIFSISLYHIRKWPINPRIYLIFIMIFLYLHSILNPINIFCNHMNQPITPYVFPFLMSHTNSVLLIMFGVALLFCDAPFVEIDQPYIILRSGRRIWVAGNILYILIASLIYISAILIFSLLILSPNLEFSMDWGKVIGTFAQTNISPRHNIFIPFSFSIFNAYPPVLALCISFLNCWLISFALGMLMFVLNLNFSRFAGILGASLLIFWQVAVTKMWTGFTKFSPVTWVSLAQIDTNNSTLYPSLQHVYISITIAIIILTILCMTSMRKRDIDILKSV